MKRTEELASRFREVVLNGTWVANTNYKDQLSQVDWKEATTKVGSLNTLALLAFHINYYIAGINEVFRGGDLVIRDKYSFDMSPITSEQEWQDLLSSFWTNAEEFAQHVENLEEETLGAIFVKEQYGTYQRSIDGMIEHCYCHLGQVTIIRKMIREGMA